MVLNCFPGFWYAHAQVCRTKLLCQYHYEYRWYWLQANLPKTKVLALVIFWSTPLSNSNYDVARMRYQFLSYRISAIRLTLWTQLTATVRWNFLWQHYLHGHALMHWSTTTACCCPVFSRLVTFASLTSLPGSHSRRYHISSPQC